MSKRPDPREDVKRVREGYRKLDSAMSGRNPKAGAYDREGKLIPGTEPAKKPAKSKRGAYDRYGNFIPGSEPPKAPKRSKPGTYDRYGNAIVEMNKK